jgi:hypothetical protein
LEEAWRKKTIKTIAHALLHRQKKFDKAGDATLAQSCPGDSGKLPSLREEGAHHLLVYVYSI